MTNKNVPYSAGALPLVQETKPVWVATVNTDLTEGRGYSVILAVSESKATVIRVGKGKNTMGTDANIHAMTAVKVNNTWLYPVEPLKPTADDEEADYRQSKLDKIAEKARAAGLTDADLDLLRSAKGTS